MTLAESVNVFVLESLWTCIQRYGDTCARDAPAPIYFSVRASVHDSVWIIYSSIHFHVEQKIKEKL
jgi:hypothetical protein